MLKWLIMLTVGILAVPSFGRSPQHLQELLSEMDKLGASPERLAAIDEEAAQKDAVRSRLFWYTDLSEAVSAAKASGKPILSLRLLGRLDEELSCANSRFFRKTLYSDPQLSSFLRSQYILHWESVRPVPIVTIDYGNGTVIKRTLTGNSIHYLLAPDGRVIDALPGLVDATTFERETRAFAEIVQSDPAVRSVTLAKYRYDVAARLAFAPAAPLPAARLADRAAPKAMTKRIVEAPLLAATRNPSEYVKADTLQNQKVLRPQILAWIKAESPVDLKKLNQRVYAELFLTPLNDPLMGLGMPDESALVGTMPVSPVAVKFSTLPLSSPQQAR